MNRTTARTLTALAALTLGSAAMAQGTMDFDWEISGDWSMFTLTLSASMDPGEVGFAGSIFEIAGNDRWQLSTIVSYDNYLDELTDDGQLQGDNSITNIEAFQLPPYFNPDFNDSNPITLYEISFIPGGGGGVIEFWTQNHINGDVYTDDFGSSVPYTVDPAYGIIFPAPASMALLTLAGLVASRRRR